MATDKNLWNNPAFSDGIKNLFRPRPSNNQLNTAQDERTQQNTAAPIDNQCFTFKISLRRVTPVIWRRFKVESSTSLSRFHVILQAIMGWKHCHLHKFQQGNIEHYLEEGQEDYGINLSQMNLTVGSELLYEYDFGDGWEHDIVLESVDDIQETENLPMLLDGKNACPPEDCGSPTGFMSLKKILRMKRGKDEQTGLTYKEMIEWLEERHTYDYSGYDPYEFDSDNDKFVENLRYLDEMIERYR